MVDPEYGATLLHWACSVSNLTVCSSCLHIQHYLHRTSEFLLTRTTQLIKMLVRKYRLALDAPAADRSTPIMWAASSSDSSAVGTLFRWSSMRHVFSAAIRSSSSSKLVQIPLEKIKTALHACTTLPQVHFETHSYVSAVLYLLYLSAQRATFLRSRIWWSSVA
jgi:hypothetical protein